METIHKQIITYRISSFSFRGNHYFLTLEIAENSNSCRKVQSFT